MLRPSAANEPEVMPRGERAKVFLGGLVRLVALVIVAGGIGVALGMGLSALSADEEPATTGGGAGATVDTEFDAAETTTGSTRPAARVPAETMTATVPAIPAVTATTTTPSTPSGRFAQVRVSVLDSRLFTDSTPSGREEQRSRVTVRIRAENRGFDRVTLDAPTLRVGSVRIPVDPDGDGFAPLGPGTDMTVTLRFALAGEATPKVVRDRRARILVAGRSLPVRVKVQAPTR